MLRLAVILGLLSLVGPFAIDMYLPALPEISRELGTTESQVQATLAAYFAAFGLAQVVYGPVTDQIGRKPPILAGLLIFLAGSLGAATAGSIGALIAWRAVQGLGSAALMAVPRAVIRDRYTGPQATRLMSTVILIFSVSPMLAPLAGAGVIAIAGWRWIFGAMALTAMLSAIVTVFALPETLAPEKRRRFNLASFRQGAGVLLCDPAFLGATFIGGFGMASFFVFIASGSFVYRGEFGLTPTQFSMAFAVNAMGFILSSQLAANLAGRLGPARAILFAVAGFCVCTLTLFIVVLAGLGTLPVIVAGLLAANACMGLVIPTTMVLAMEEHGEFAGLAASLGGALQMLTGGAMITVSGVFFDGTAAPMIGAIAFCGVAALALALLVVPRRRQASA